LALRCSIRLSCSWCPPVAIARTDNSGRPILRPHALTLICRFLQRPIEAALTATPRAPKEMTGLCACTHYPVFKEPTGPRLFPGSARRPRRLTDIVWNIRLAPVPPLKSALERPYRLSVAVRLGEPSKVTSPLRACQPLPLAPPILQQVPAETPLPSFRKNPRCSGSINVIGSTIVATRTQQHGQKNC
jgi:hypothetical protein